MGASALVRASTAAASSAKRPRTLATLASPGSAHCETTRPPSSKRSVRPGSARRRRHCCSAHSSVAFDKRCRAVMPKELPASVAFARRASASMAAAPHSSTRRWASSSETGGRNGTRFCALTLMDLEGAGRATPKRSSFLQGARSPRTPKAPLYCGVEVRLTTRTNAPGRSSSAPAGAAAASGCMYASLSCSVKSATSTSWRQRFAKNSKTSAWLRIGAKAASARADSVTMSRAPGSRASLLVGTAPNRQRRETAWNQTTSARAGSTNLELATQTARTELVGK
mmetsp:Transcript_47248/g.145493  ORF Transcript_47248/g.145493 Transcript_47248/m.145493 type:complete len:283 (+) Transcript_47248:671-1519(+)